MTSLPKEQKFEQDDGFFLVRRTALADATEQSSRLLPVAKVVKEESKDTKGPDLTNFKLALASAGGGKLKEIRTRIGYDGTLAVNSTTNGKYLLDSLGVGQAGIGSVVISSPDHTTFSSVFNEFYVHSVKAMFVPDNRYSSNFAGATSAGGSPGFSNTTSVVIAPMQTSSTYTDSASAGALMLGNNQMRIKSLSDSWSVTWSNERKFEKNGDVDSSTSSQSWMVCASAASYGGRFQMWTPYPSAAAAAKYAFLQAVVFGYIYFIADVSYRYRI